MRAKEMGFVGKITASMTHEIKNALAIILESAGLLSDLLNLSQQCSFPYREKFQKVLGTISAQVQRGVLLATRLNQFAHSMDEPWAEVRLGDFLELAAALMQRLLRRRGISLAAEPPSREIVVRTDAFRLLLIICTLLEALGENLEANGEIVLKCQPPEADTALVLQVKGTPKPQWDAVVQGVLANLEQFLQELRVEPALSLSPSPPGVLLGLTSLEPGEG